MNWSKLREIFESACDLDAVERAQFLDHACAGDTQLRDEVVSLIACSDRAEAFLESPAVATMPEDTVLPFDLDLVGQIVGPYRIERLIASGGMGTVYLAHRIDHVTDQTSSNDPVAIKVIRHERLTAKMIRRFHRERRMLGSMSHPNVAKLLDSGVTEDGQPYLVMEFIAGDSLHDYCIQRQCSARRRLTLFRTVCEAVQHAHQKLLVHRDLKPANILVTDDGTVKLLDFGIGKMLDTDEPGRDLHTTTGPRMMTPEYASPEQIRGQLITTASDVYSLGVILFELMTGAKPYALDRTPLYEMERVICEEEPKPPSTVARQMARDGRQEAPARVDGDVDAIVLKALQKDPLDRYPSVEQFADDIGRLLDGLPVRAQKSTFRYRATKFIRRNRWPVATTIAIFFSLLIGLTGTTRFAIDATRQRDRAAKAEKQAIADASRAQIEAQKSSEISAFLREMLSSVQPERDGRDVTVREVLDRASRRAIEDPWEAPEARGDILATIGESYAGLGHYDAAEKNLREALQIRQHLPGSTPAEIGDVRHALGKVLFDHGRYTEAQAQLHEALALRRMAASPSVADIAETLNVLANLFHKQGDYATMAPLNFELSKLRPDIETKSDPFDLVLLADLDVNAKDDNTKDDDAQLESEFQSVFQRWRSDRGYAHPDSVEQLNSFAVIRLRRNRLRTAEIVFREALRLANELYGPTHPDTATIQNNLGHTLRSRGKTQESMAILHTALGDRLHLLGPNHTSVATTLHNLAATLYDQHRYYESLALLMESLSMNERNFPGPHPNVASTLCRIAKTHEALGQFDQAEQRYHDALSMYRQSVGIGHPHLAATLVEFGNFLIARQRPIEAELYLREALSIDHRYPLRPDRAELTMRALIHSLERQLRLPEAQQLERTFHKTTQRPSSQTQ